MGDGAFLSACGDLAACCGRLAASLCQSESAAAAKVDRTRSEELEVGGFELDLAETVTGGSSAHLHPESGATIGLQVGKAALSRQLAATYAKSGAHFQAKTESIGSQFRPGTGALQMANSASLFKARNPRIPSLESSRFI